MLGLLVACEDHEATQDGTIGSMWWIDVAGSYQVRAFAIGGGKLETNSKDDNNSNDNNLSAGQLCDLRTRPVHVASRTAIYGFGTISDDATALR